MEGFFFLGILFTLLVLIISVGIGLWSRGLTRTVGDYFVTGRRIGAVNNGLALFGLAISMTTFIGLSALIIEGLYLAIASYTAFTAAFIGMLILAAPYLRRHKSYTSMAFIGDRYYSRNLRIFSVVIMLVVCFLYLGANIKGIGIVFEYLLGFPELIGIILGGIIVTLYVVLGGMYGVTFTQAFQGVLVIFCLIIPVSIVLRELGADAWAFPPLGYGELVPFMKEEVPEYFWPMVVHPGFYLSLFLGTFFGIIGLPHFVMRYFTVRDAKEARWSTLLCVLLVGLVNTTVYATGFAAVYSIQLAGGEERLAGASRLFLETDLDHMVFILTEILAGEGWLAVAIAGAMAAALSTVAGLLIIMGAGLVHDLYGSINPHVDDQQKMKISFWVMLGAGILVTLLSIRPPEFILEAIMWAFGIASASLGVPIVLGIWWKRTTREGAAAGMIVGFALTFISWLLVEMFNVAPTELPLPFIASYLYGPMGWLKLMAFAVPLSFIVTVVVSWFTSEPPEGVKRTVDEMHGWPDYEESRYKGWGLPVTIVVLSLAIIYFMTTFYGVFSRIG